MSENCTYFSSSGSEGDICTVEICKCKSDVCQVTFRIFNVLYFPWLHLLLLWFQLRLDLTTFMIAGPSTSSVLNTKLLNGQTAATAGGDATNYGQCITDSFSVTNPGGPSPPTICGTNTGEHSEFYSCKSNKITID